MTNESIFLAQSLFMGAALLVALRLGKEALIALIALLAVLANLFVVKQISLFGFNATAADAYAVGCMLGINLLQEYYGKPTAKQAVLISFFVSIIFTVSSQVHRLYLPFVHDTTHHAFETILCCTPRIVIASLISYCIVQLCDIKLYGFLKAHLNNRWYLIRNYGSVSVSQLLDTVLFSFLGLYAIVDNIWHIIFVSYVIKIAVLLLSTPFLILSQRIITIRK